MKINYDLIRETLTVIEEISNGTTNFGVDGIWEEYFKENYTYEIFRYHVKYLRDTNLIEPYEGNYYIIDITPHGRSYLDNIRDNTIWNQTKDKIKPLGNVTMDVISDIAKSLLMKSLGLS